MHISLHVFFLILALVLGLLATFNVPSSKFNLLAGCVSALILAEFFV